MFTAWIAPAQGRRARDRNERPPRVNCSQSSTPTLFPIRLSGKLVNYFTDHVGWRANVASHINGDYNLLIRLQSIMLDGQLRRRIKHTRIAPADFSTSNGTAGILAAAKT